MNKRTLAKSMSLSAALALVLALPASAADGDKSKIKGLITSVQGDTIVVKDANNVEQTITLSPSTTYKRTKGLTGVVHEKAQQSALMPGLPVTVDAVAAGSGFNATEVSFKSEDFRTAQQVQAGLAPTTARMNEFGKYEALATTEVLFDSGSDKISDQGRSDLDAFAAKAKETQDYQVVLQGFTDSTGNAEANERLSARRAHAVASYLQKQAGLQPGRVRAGDAMGVAEDAGTGSNAGARKVVVKLIVDKGVQAGK
ncbi:OmpA family protein [Lysobacter sp.]|uniref:OmpA family protein n=1 Tax=Lysobacter sp. TaxID=72226 RepID=UPI002D5721AA|nr:OmpA family protein [Lysobacter sp.]HZX76212.1 OmpA family protein [Lysobacter sp.]